jgi:AcrR family transcriptional regulator
MLLLTRHQLQQLLEFTAQCCVESAARVTARGDKRGPSPLAVSSATLGKPSSDEDESERLIRAARKTIQENGGSGFTLNEVLEHSGLGTRAFYRHFASKDDLALAVFAAESEREAKRLEKRTRSASTPIEGVVAWIDARLELGFDQRRSASQRPLSEEAMRASKQFPKQLEPAFNRTLAPLVEQLTLGAAQGVFGEIDVIDDAKAILHVVSGVVEQRWSGFALRYRETRERTLRFCLAALEVDPLRIEEILHVHQPPD